MVSEKQARRAFVVRLGVAVLIRHFAFSGAAPALSQVAEKVAAAVAGEKARASLPKRSESERAPGE